MGWRFRRTLKILPGVRLNISKSGISASVGVRGAHVTLGGKGGPRLAVGLPGTGISYTKSLKGGGRAGGRSGGGAEETLPRSPAARPAGGDAHAGDGAAL